MKRKPSSHEAKKHAFSMHFFDEQATQSVTDSILEAHSQAGIPDREEEKQAPSSEKKTP